ncbi:MAG TPA: hypothetical protein VK589_00365 [Chryseolinea sp.]|nr:hypothetical protein [Chryseolinea sp.]
MSGIGFEAVPPDIAPPNGVTAPIAQKKANHTNDQPPYAKGRSRQHG